jgi:hypothetical protein
MIASLDLLLTKMSETAFHLIDPRTVGGCEVQVVARALGQPFAHECRLVGGIVIQDDMDLLIFGHSGIDLVQKVAKFHRAVSAIALGEHVTGGHLQSREERRRAMAHVIMSAPLNLPRAHGQERLAALKGLNLTLLVDAEHHRVERRFHVKAHKLTNLFDELGILRERETLAAMGLQAESPPNAADALHLLTRDRPFSASGSFFGLRARPDFLSVPYQ